MRRISVKNYFSLFCRASMLRFDFEKRVNVFHHFQFCIRGCFSCPLDELPEGSNTIFVYLDNESKVRSELDAIMSLMLDDGFSLRVGSDTTGCGFSLECGDRPSDYQLRLSKDGRSRVLNPSQLFLFQYHAFTFGVRDDDPFSVFSVFLDRFPVFEKYFGVQ